MRTRVDSSAMAAGRPACTASLSSSACGDDTGVDADEDSEAWCEAMRVI
jgi:hypothetical protein